jgi:hypothetical protein
MPTSGANATVTTYTGGCGTGVVDLNPHLNARIKALLIVSIELVNDAGATIERSGPFYNNVVYPGVDIDCGRWHVAAPPVGAEVHVFAEIDGEVIRDTARCAT